MFTVLLFIILLISVIILKANEETQRRTGKKQLILITELVATSIGVESLLLNNTIAY